MNPLCIARATALLPLAAVLAACATPASGAPSPAAASTGAASSSGQAISPPGGKSAFAMVYSATVTWIDPESSHVVC